MKKLFLIICVLVLSMSGSFAFAEVSTQGLSKTQSAELALQAAKMQAESEQAKVPSEPLPVKVVVVSDAALDITKKWADAGKGLTIGIVEAAKTAGVAMNEFADSPVGRMTTAIIVWKMMGKDILHLFIGLSLLFIVLPTVAIWWRSVATIKVEYEQVPFFWWTRRRVVRRVYKDGEEFVGLTVLACGASIVIFGAAMGILP